MKTPFDDPVARHHAGRFGMTLFLISLGVLFGATVIGLLVVRVELTRKGLWPGDLPRLPWGMAVSTAVIVASSVVMHRAALAARRVAAGDAGAAAAVRRGLRATAALGGVFLLLQAACWLSWLDVVGARWAASEEWRMALTAFYVLTGLHGAHVLGGLVALITTAVRDGLGHYTPDERVDRAHYCAMYWHFLGAAWLAIYALLLLWS